MSAIDNFLNQRFRQYVIENKNASRCKLYLDLKYRRLYNFQYD